MRQRRDKPALTASPVLIGAVTVLIAIVAVFISYNANQGLPFVPTYDVKVVLPNGGKLDRGQRRARRRLPRRRGRAHPQRPSAGGRRASGRSPSCR